MSFEIGNYIIHKNFGLGKIKKFPNNNTISISFIDGVKNLIYLNEETALNYFTPIDEDNLKYLEYGYENKNLYFDNRTINRALEYVNSESISELKSNKDSIEASIIGSYRYKTKISFKDDTLRFTCSCPVGYQCKHSYALLKYITKSYNQLKNEKAEKEDLNSLFNHALEFHKPFDYHFYNQMVTALNKGSVNIAISYLLSKKDNLEEKDILLLYILKVILENDKKKYKELIDNLFKDKDEKEYFKFRLLLKMDNTYDVPLNNILNGLYASNYLTVLTSASFSNVTPEYLDFLEVIDDAIHSCLDEILESYSGNEKVLLSFLLHFSKYTSRYTEYVLYKDKYPSFQSRLVKDITRKNPSIILSLSEETFFSLIQHERIYDRDIYLPLLAKKIKNLNEKYYKDALALALSNSDLYYNLEYVDEIINNIPNNSFALSLKNIISSNNKYNLDFESEDFEKYFNIGAYIEYDQRNILNSTVEFKISVSDYTFEMSLPVNYFIELYLDLSNRKLLWEIKLVEKLINENIASFGDRFKDIYLEIKNLDNERKVQELQEIVDVFYDSYNQKITRKYNINALYTLEPIFEINDSSIDLSFKIGNGKMFVLKDIGEFIDKFITGDEISLGKYDSFVCDRDNLNNKSKRLLDVLNKMYIMHDIYTQIRRISISRYTFDEILNIYKNEIIQINNKRYFVKLDNLDLNVSIGEDYKLNLEPQIEKFIHVDDKLIVLINNTIYYLDLKNYSFDLFLALYKLKNKDISLIKNDFINKIYPLISDSLNLDEHIKDEFKISPLQIDSYFDYEDKIIKLKTKYRLNKEEINKENINDIVNLNKINRYQKLMINMGFDSNTLSSINDDDNVYSFFKCDFSELKKIANVYLSDSILNKQIVSFKSPSFKIQYNNNLMNCFFEKSNFSEEELYEILKSIRKKKKYVLLKNNQIIDLDNEDANVFYNLVSSLELDEKHLYTEDHEPLYKTMKLLNYMDHISMDSYINEMVNSIASFKNAKYDLPKLNGELRNYQVEGYKWLKVLEKYNLGGILADDMGLGKSLEIISLLKSNESNSPSLIVCPTSLIFNWMNEFRKFDGETEVIEIYGGSKERKDIITSISENKKVIYITSYDSLRNDIDNYNVNFNYLIIDEAQYIKNVEALKTRKVKEINAHHRLALTGTPIENNLLDLWSLFDYIMPKYLDGITKFKENCLDDEYIKFVSKKVAPFILRRTKKEVLKDLPSKTERIISSEMTSSQRKMYDAMCLKARREMEESNSPFNVLHLLTRLRQICVSPSLFSEEYKEGSGKIETLMEITKEYIKNDHRLLIFSQFVTALDLIEKELNKENIKYLKLTGETKANKRIDDMNEFNKNDEIKVFLISLKAGGTGLNLIGADTIIHMDPWWNVSSENQASDRAYRIGQTRNVEVIKLIAKNSIEQRVIELQELKKDLIDRVISNDDSSITRLSNEDIEFLLK